MATKAKQRDQYSDPSLEISVEHITKAMCEEWLTLITRQRTIRKARVVSIARDIFDGNWQLSGEAFKFDESGAFVDGQHRAHAIIMAAKMAEEAGRKEPVVEAVVIRGVPEEAMTILDTGAARSPADQLNIANFEHPTQLAASAKWIILFQRDALYSDRLLQTVTHSEIRRFVDNNEGLGRIIDIGISRLRKNVDAITPAALHAAYYLCWLQSPDEADWFFDKLATGVSLDEGSPILALRSRLRQIRLDKTRLKNPDYLSLVIRTWNAVREGRELQSIAAFRRGQAIKCPTPK